MRALKFGLALTLLGFAAGCGSQPSPPPTGSAAATCVNSKAPHRAYVVVEHASGAVNRVCVGFSTATLNGKDAMKQSGIQFTSQHFSFGDAVCAIQGEPAHYTKCLAPSGSYWSTWVEHGGKWQEAQTGFADVKLAPGDALGWRYESQTASPAPPPA